MKRVKIIAAAVILMIAAVTGALWLRAHRAPRIDAGDAALVATGRGVYDRNCASCHGNNLEGQPNWRERLPNGRLPAPPHNAQGHTWHHSDRQLFQFTKEGMAGILPGYQSDMPAFGDVLSDAEIRAALAYIKSTWPAEIRAAQQRITEKDEQSSQQ